MSLGSAGRSHHIHPGSQTQSDLLRLIIKCLCLLLLLILILIPTVQSHPNQQLIIDFDEDQTGSSQADQTKRPTLDRHSASESSSPASQPVVPPVPVPEPTGLPAALIKRLTGWNDSVVAKLIGQISPRAPHPFVVSIDDENYEQVIQTDLDSIREGWGSDQNTVWVISVLATDRSSILFDQQFDRLASNSSLALNPIPPKKREDEIDVIRKDPKDPYVFKPEIRFGRIDYMAKTDFILTKWLIFKCPVLVIITNRGNDLRFFKTGSVPPTADHLGDFLRHERWLMKPTWNSTFSKGNAGEWVVTLAARMFQALHLLTDRVPGWMLMILSSMLGTSLMQWLHKPQPKRAHPTQKTQSGRQSISSSSSPRTSNRSATDSILHQTRADLASPEMKKNLSDAAVQLVKITDQKIGRSKPEAQDDLPPPEPNPDSNTRRSVRKRKN